MTKPRILVVEDDSSVVVFLTDLLEFMGYVVRTAQNGLQALDRIREEVPNLIVLDVMMPELDGYEVCRQLKADVRTRQIPVLMLTAKGQVPDKVKGLDIGADDYLAKPYDKAELEARVRALLRRTMPPPFSATQIGCLFSLSLVPTQRVNIRVDGSTTMSHLSRDRLDIDEAAYSRQADNTFKNDWRFNSKQAGKDLHHKIFDSHPEVLASYAQGLGEIGEADEQLFIRFESARAFLRVPLEFLFGGIADNPDYFILRHPVSRSITGVPIKRASLSPAYLNEMWGTNSPLKILLIASNTKPDIPGVDDEVLSLETFLGTAFDTLGLSVEITRIPTAEATYERIRRVLHKNQYHIIHYAGHGLHDVISPEKSCLFFYEKENRQGVVLQMAVSELKILLKGSSVRFIYLSCCLGAKTADSLKLLDDDFLGLAEGLIQAGVPSVLAFRWPVSDIGAKTLAIRFYESLASQGRIDTALLHARQEVVAHDRDDITWLSPILIMQA